MNRTDRLYALVEQLRAVAPRPRTAAWLAAHFEVSVRTIERDIGALLESGVPIHGERGRTGGYVVDRARTLPPLNVTPSEAAAIAVALQRLDGTPFADDARSALHKLLAVMPAGDVADADALARRVHLVVRREGPAPVAVPRALGEALTAGRVLRLRYVDRRDRSSTRLAEPVGFVGDGDRWYLLAWCRLRDGPRLFRLDRIVEVVATGEVVPARTVDLAPLHGPERTASQVTVRPVAPPPRRLSAVVG